MFSIFRFPSLLLPSDSDHNNQNEYMKADNPTNGGGTGKKANDHQRRSCNEKAARNAPMLRSRKGHGHKINNTCDDG